MMRSQSALPKQETRVELVFSDRGEVYRIVRSPSYERPSLRKKKDGEQAMTTQPAEYPCFFRTARNFPERFQMSMKKYGRLWELTEGSFHRRL